MPITGSKSNHKINIDLNLFSENFGKKLQNVTNSINKNVSRVQRTSENMGISTESLEKYQNMFNLSLTKTGKSLVTNENKLLKNSAALNNYVAENAGFGSMMKMNREQFGNVLTSGNKMNRMGGKVGLWLRKATAGMKGFKMEMLGVMFFGMSLTRVVSGLIKTSQDWLGVNEVLTTTLGLLFLPVAELLLDWALNFLEFVGNLSEETKKTIGFIVLFVAGLGILLTVVGTLALGVGSLILAFGTLFSPIGLFLGALAALAGYFIFKTYFKDTGEAVDKLRIKLMAFGVSGEAFDKIINKIKEWYFIAKSYLSEKFAPILSSVKEKIKGFINNLKETISTEIENNKEGFIQNGKKIMGNLILGAKNYLSENPMVLIGAITGAMLGGPVGASIGAVIGTMFSKIDVAKIKEFSEKGLEILEELITGIKNNLGKLEEIIIDLASKLTEFIILHADDFAEIGLKIAAAIVSGVGKGIKNKMDELKNSFREKFNISPGGTLDELLFGHNISTNEKVEDAIISPSGKIISTSPKDYLIATKNPAGLANSGSSGGIVISPTYYVTVSDKKEFEGMLRENERRITSDIRRLTR